ALWKPGSATLDTMGSRLDTITGRMAKLMSKRWSMLAEVCPRDGCSAPLMRNPETSESKCVWHDARELFPEEAAAAADDEEPTAAEPATSPSCSSVLDEKLDTPTGDDLLRLRKREQGDLASERIGKRLLQGWALIDRCCPAESCYSVPLVQNKSKVQECVICAQRYMDEDAYIAKYGALSASAEPREAAVATPKGTAPVAPKESLSVELKAEAPAARRPAAGSALAAAVCALDEKIAVLSAQLAAATDPSTIESIAHAIAACAKALRECNRAH
ncbi:hypothetical protein H4R21_002989, partial [Coemansia helicoidea]